VEKLSKERVSWQVFLLIMANLRVLAPDSFLISKNIRYEMSVFVFFFGFTKSDGS
jgi:hypothetical protein